MRRKVPSKERSPQSTAPAPSPRRPSPTSPTPIRCCKPAARRPAERAEPADRLDRQASQFHDARIFSVVAIGGMGKCALTWHWFHEIAPQEMKPLAGRMWWSFYECDASFENFVIRALCYVSGQSEEEVRKLPRRIGKPGCCEPRRQPFLIVLDGLERILIAYARMDAAGWTTTTTTRPPTASPGHWACPPSAASRSSASIACGAPPTRESGSSCGSSPRYASRGSSSAPGFTPPNCKGDGRPLSRMCRLFPARPRRAGRARPLAGVGRRGRAVTAAGVPHLRQPSVAHPGPGRRGRELSPYARRLRKMARRRIHNSTLPTCSWFNRASHILQFALNGLSPRPRRAVDDRRLSHPGELRHSGSAADRRPQSFHFCAELDRALTELEDRGLIGWDRAANRYDAHPIVRGVAWQLTAARTNRRSTQLSTRISSRWRRRNGAEVESLADLTPAIERSTPWWAQEL